MENEKLRTDEIQEEDPDLELLKKTIKKNLGFNCEQYKESHFRRRINVRVRATNSRSYAEYLKILKRDLDEYRYLIEALTVNVSEFFRNPETYAVIEKEVLPALIESQSNSLVKAIRIWSAGCAAGEEAYSLAIMLHRMLGKDFGKYRISILGTDIDSSSLEKARKGVYSESALKNVDEKTRERYFIKKGGMYQVTDQLKNITHFKQHDLISGPKLSHFDMIICRNVMIYFNKEIQEQLHLDFYKALSQGGFFIIGKAETLLGTAASYFKPFNTRERLYVKENEGTIHGKRGDIHGKRDQEAK